MNSISFSCDDVDFVWEEEDTLTHWLFQISHKENHTIQALSYVYCSDDRLLQMNQQYLDHDFFTDIITFDLSDSDEIEGEIYISVDRVRANALNYNSEFEIELCRVMAHGLLHLIGYNDQSTEERMIMRTKEDACLSLLSKVPRGTFSTESN